MFQIKCKHSKIYKLFKWNHHWSLKTEKLLNHVYKSQAFPFIDLSKAKQCPGLTPCGWRFVLVDSHRFTRSLVLRFLSQNHLKPSKTQLLLHVSSILGSRIPAFSLPFSDLSTSVLPPVTFWPFDRRKAEWSSVQWLRSSALGWWTWTSGDPKKVIQGDLVENVLNISRRNITCSYYNIYIYTVYMLYI